MNLHDTNQHDLIYSAAIALELIVLVHATAVAIAEFAAVVVFAAVVIAAAPVVVAVFDLVIHSMIENMHSLDWSQGP